MERLATQAEHSVNKLLNTYHSCASRNPADGVGPLPLEPRHLMARKVLPSPCSRAILWREERPREEAGGMISHRSNRERPANIPGPFPEKGIASACGDE